MLAEKQERMKRERQESGDDGPEPDVDLNEEDWQELTTKLKKMQ